MNSDMFGAINQAIKAYSKMQKSGYGNSFLNPYNNYNQMNINNNPYYGLGNGGYLPPYNNHMNYQNPQIFNNNIV